MTAKQHIPEINIGLVGHVDHGKTTLVKALSGHWTDTHSEEIKRGITIRLGYANATIYLCSKCKKLCVSDKCPYCKGSAKAKRTVSFVDAPGHESLMATMLAGATIMDGALLLIASNEKCPQPQTREHLMALEIIGIKNIVIVQNKVDIVSKEQAIKNYGEIKDFIKGTTYENAKIVPVSAQQLTNIDCLLEAIEECIPSVKRDDTKEPLLYIARSFDINRPGTPIPNLHGGILGGALKQGVLKVGQEIEIKPGIKEDKKGKDVWNPVKTKIVSIKTGELAINKATPGGSVAIETELDPYFVKSDNLSGNLVGLVGKLPSVWERIKLDVKLLDRVVGAKDDLLVDQIKLNEILMLNVNSATTVGVVSNLSKSKVECVLKIPICAELDSRVTISRKIGSRWRLIGYGILSN